MRSAVPSRVIPLTFHTQDGSGCYSQLHSWAPLSATASKYTGNRYRTSRDFVGSRNNCVSMVFTAESRRKAVSRQVRSSNGCYLFRRPHGPDFLHPFCLIPTVGTVGMYRIITNKKRGGRSATVCRLLVVSGDDPGRARCRSSRARGCYC